MYALEIFGAIFSILGAWQMSYAQKEYLYKSFILFFLSNSALLLFFLVNGKIPLIIQFVFFLITSILGIIRMSNNREKSIKYLYIYLSIFTLVLIGIVFQIKETSFEIQTIDMIASFMAILGSLLLSSFDYIKRNLAFTMFILADLLFVYIAIINGFYFFLLQSLFFVITGTRGLYKNIKLNKKEN